MIRGQGGDDPRWVVGQACTTSHDWSSNISRIDVAPNSFVPPRGKSCPHANGVSVARGGRHHNREWRAPHSRRRKKRL